MQNAGISRITPSRQISFAAVTLLAVGVFLLLAANRGLDNNSLVSWRWVFALVSPGSVLLPICLLVAGSYWFAKRFDCERYAAPILFVAAFAVGTLFWRIPEVIVDASRYFTQAKYLELYGAGYFLREWGLNIFAWTDMPLIPFVYGVIFKVFGESRLYIQVFTTMLYASTVVLTYQVGKMLWDKSTGFLGGLLLLGMPYLFTQVPLMLVDIPAMFFLMLAVFLFIKALTQGGTALIALSGLAIWAAVLTKYSNVLMLSVLPVALVVLLVAKRTRGEVLPGWPGLSTAPGLREMLFRGAAVALVASVLIGVVVAWKYEIFAAQAGLLMDYQRPGLKRWGESHVSTFLFQVHPFVTGAALLSVYAAVKKRDLRFVVVGWLVAVVLLLQIERIRYMISVLPMLALMAAYGLQVIRSVELRRYVALCAVASSLSIGLFAYLPFMERISAANLKAAGEYLNASGAKNIKVVTVPAGEASEVNPAVAVPLLDLFVDGAIRYDAEPARPLPKSTLTSSLRFTWEHKNPEYYSDDQSGADHAVVVISDDRGMSLTDAAGGGLVGYRRAKTFDDGIGFFRYQTVVEVYEPLSMAVSARSALFAK